MPTISKSTLKSQLVARTEDALRAADADGDDAVDAQDRARLPSDVRGLADSTADYYLSGGAMGISDYVAAYKDYVAGQLDDADLNGDGKLSNSEQDRLPPTIYNSVLALRIASTAPVDPPTTPVDPPSTTPVDPPSTTPPSSSSGGVLGISGTMSASRARVRTILDQGLDKPSSVAFNPRDGKLWVVNRGDDSAVVITGATGSAPSGRKYSDDSDHFMNNPLGLAFSPVYAEMATIQDSTNDYNQGGLGNMFTGPTLWPSDASFNGKAACHLDMLHHSPVSVGICAGTEYPNNREYWVFNGEKGAIDRYFFNQPHVPGGDDHSDGLTLRYDAGALSSKAHVPANLALDDDGTLYIADTGNGRIAKLNTKADFQSNNQQIVGHHDETPLYKINGVSIEDVVGGLSSPSGLAVVDGHLVVGEYGTGRIKVFTKDGTKVGELDTGLGTNALGGIAVKDGKIYAADMKTDRVVEISVG